MLEREATTMLSDHVEIDDAYIGGERAGKVGRGAAGKTPFVAAVKTDLDGRPQRMALHKVGEITSEQIEAFACKEPNQQQSCTAMDCSASPW